jgi:hypothetical protein
MAFVEMSALRNEQSRTYADDVNPNRRTFVGGPVMCYDAGGGKADTPVDLSLGSRVNNAGFDGWRTTANGWRYAIGMPKTGALSGLDGVVGFGGRRGQNWLRFRLERAGSLYVPSGSPDLATKFSSIGATATYVRSNLSRTANTITLPDGTQQAVGAEVNWRGLWTTPGGGEVWLRHKLSGCDLKEEIVVNQAAREWLMTNRAPATPEAATYFAFVFRLDWSDVPKIVRQSAVSKDADFSDADGAIRLDDASDRLLAFMPVDYAYVDTLFDTGERTTDGQPQLEPRRTRERLLKRFWRDGDGNHYLGVGLTWERLRALPAGDVIFDPTFTGTVSSNSDNARINDLGYDDGAGVTNVAVGGVGTSPQVDHGLGWRFPSVTIPQGSTVSSARLSLMKTTTQWGQINCKWGVENSDNAATFSAGSPPGVRTLVGEVDDQSNVNRLINTRYFHPHDTAARTELGGHVQTVVARPGWASGNALVFVCNSDLHSAPYLSFARSPYDYNSAGAGREPQIEIDYTAPAGGDFPPLPSQIESVRRMRYTRM